MRLSLSNTVKRLLPQACCLIAIALVWQPASAEIFKTVDENGKVVFTDTPGSDKSAEAVELPELNTQPSTPVTRPSAKPREAKAPTQYLIAVTSPSNETQIPMGQNLVPVSVQLQPKLFKGHKVQLILNGSRFGPAREKTSFTVDNLYRGQHELQAAVVNAKGKVISRSKSVTVYVQRRSALN